MNLHEKKSGFLNKVLRPRSLRSLAARGLAGIISDPFFPIFYKKELTVSFEIIEKKASIIFVFILKESVSGLTIYNFLIVLIYDPMIFTPLL